MKWAQKRWMTAMLSVAMISGMAVPAFAAEYKVSALAAAEYGWKSVYDIKNVTKETENFTCYDYIYYAGEKFDDTENFSEYYQGSLDTAVYVTGMEKIDVKWMEKSADGSYKAVKNVEDDAAYIDNHISNATDEALLAAYLKSDEFEKKDEELGGELTDMLTDSGIYTDMCFGTNIGFQGFEEGSYFTFKQPGAYLINAQAGHMARTPSEKYKALIVIGEAAAATTPAASETQSTETNAAPATKPVAGTVTATPTTTSVIFNDMLEVPMDAYNIDGNNYFKLRDLAYLANTRQQQFCVTWDAEKKAINLITGESYNVIGTELQLGDGQAKPAQKSTAAIYLNGEAVEMNAYTIGGNTYFKLRDLADKLGFGVEWEYKVIMLNIA